MASFYTEDPSRDIEAILRQHQMEQWHLCTACGSQFSDKGDLVEHMQCHALTEARKCTITKAVVTSRGAKDNSLYMSKKFIVISHDWKVKGLPDVKDLKREGESQHQDRKSFSCDDCGKNYDGRLQLAIHDFCKRSYGRGCSETAGPLPRDLPSSSLTGEDAELRSSTSSQSSSFSSTTSVGKPRGKAFTTKHLPPLHIGTGDKKIRNLGSSGFDAKTIQGVRSAQGLAAGVGKATTFTSVQPRNPPKKVEQPKSSFTHRRGSCTCVMCSTDASAPSEFSRVHNSLEGNQSGRGGRGGPLGAARQRGARGGSSGTRRSVNRRFLPY